MSKNSTRPALTSFCDMGGAQEIQLQIKATQGAYPDGAGPTREEKCEALETASPPPPATRRSLRWWLMVAVDMFLVLAGQTVATLLGRFYYNSGGGSKWLTTLTQSAAAPLLVVPLLLSSRRLPPPPRANMAAVYAALGLLLGFDYLMYSYGLLYLPVSTFSLVSASQLAFNAVFSYLLNAQRFTALIANSVVLLTLSSALLGATPAASDGAAGAASGKYALGFVLTLAASAAFSLVLSLIELAFEKVAPARTLAAVLELQLWTNVVASGVAAAGLMASGEWRRLREEMEGFAKGEAAYVATVAGAAVAWQAAAVGAVLLVARVSSLFASVTNTVALPLVPAFAVALFGDRMTGVKVVAMLMAVWGFLSYVYQHHVDACMAKNKKTAMQMQCPICAAHGHRHSNGAAAAPAAAS